MMMLFAPMSAVILVAWLGAVRETPSVAPVAAPEPRCPASTPACEAASPARAWSVPGRDLWLPRAPRHRSERPSSSSLDGEALVQETGIVPNDGGRREVLRRDSPGGRPLAGHPLSLLRPPSLQAG